MNKFTINMGRQVIYLIILAVILMGCSSSKKKENTFDKILDNSSVKTDTSVTEDLPDNARQILQNISSTPIEMAALLQETGVGFSEKYIAEVKDVDRYNTDFKRALNLGILGADLGYLNMYKKTGPVMNNMQAIRKLSEELRVKRFFDFKTIKRLATNNENLDSLMYITLSSFNNMDTYLKENGRTEVSALIICGTWIEGNYIATQVLKDATKKHKKIIERIGDQKDVIDNLTEMLSYYKNNAQFKTLYDMFIEIGNSYDGVTKTVEQGKPEEKVMDGITVFIPNEISHTKVPEKTLENIINTIEKVRTNLINL